MTGSESREASGGIVNGNGGGTVAGIDLGSNSFHMVVGRLDHGQLNILDKVRERVRLAAGLDDKRRLTDRAQQGALSCLERFAERLQGLPPAQVRAVGTNTLRQARNGREFLEAGHKALGHPIEIISGREEARLVYLGVAHSLADDAGRRLVIDIGGGSTEVILGERFEPMQRDSLYMGCVTYTKRFFNGTLSREAFDRAEIAARREFQPVEQRYASLGWSSCIGSSGTVNAIDQILRTNDWSDGGITLKGLRRLRKTLIAATGLDQLSLPGLESDRAPVFAGGVAILHAAFQSLGIERMTASTGALREGLIYDLLGRIGHEDVRDQTIRRLRETYNVDPAQADRVETLALALLDQVGLGWGVDGAAARRFLTWAAQLHEIGLSISYTGYHKHGAYIVANADLPGFSRDDQELLAALIRSHRRKLRVDDFRGLPIIRHKAALRLCVLLRLAVTLSRSRNTDPLPPLTLTVKKERFKLTFPRGWLESHPLTLADMEEEAARLEAAGQYLVSES